MQPRQISATLMIGLCLLITNSHACTTAVVSGRVTNDGRPLLWKNRDYSQRHNEVVRLTGGRYTALGVVNAGSRKSVWMGVNSAGFCIENSLSLDLKAKTPTTGPGNGGLIKRALETCASVQDFEKLLAETNITGRTTCGNFGVIDACGGAAMFEVGRSSHRMFDANDPEIAPNGYIVRSNFSVTGRNLPLHPQQDDLADTYSGGRYLRACSLLDSREPGDLSAEFVIRHCARDLADKTGTALPGSVNHRDGTLPQEIPTAETISRATSVSAAVFHGVRVGEDPDLTTMFTILGDPKFSIAVPCWVAVPTVPDDLEDERGGEIGEIALTLREWELTGDKKKTVRSQNLTGIWNDLWRIEDNILDEARSRKNHWSDHGIDPAQMEAFSHAKADTAMRAMQQELQESKNGALAMASSVPATASMVAADGVIRVAIYDHSDGTATGPTDLMQFLNLANGFQCQRVSPQQIRDGVLRDYQVLIVPGGSGSLQAKKLEETGRKNVQDFVRDGGGYVGICAGAYLATSQYTWSLGLINARVWDRVHWARGNGDVTLAMTEAGRRLLSVQQSDVSVAYAQGPLLVPDTRTHLPGYQVLASYKTEVAQKGAPEDAMVGTHAIIRTVYGKGRVICFSPHPEKPGGPTHLMTAGVRWAGLKHTEPNETAVRRENRVQPIRP